MDNLKELYQARAELSHAQTQLNSLKQQHAKLNNEKQISSAKILQIESQLKERDRLIVDAKIKENSLRDEISVLQKKTLQLQSELTNANDDLKVLQQAEKQHRDQLQYVNDQIEKQQHDLIQSDQYKAEKVVKKEIRKGENIVKLEVPEKEESAETKMTEDLPKQQDKRSRSQEQIVSEELSASEIESLGMDLEDFEASTTENLIEQPKAGRFRKFKGHREIEDIKTMENDLDHRIQAYKCRLQKGESEEDIALSVIKMGTSNSQEAEDNKKRKAYSPNRSFIDLLEDSERRDAEKKPISPETTWDEVQTPKEEEVIQEKNTSDKLLLLILAASSLVIGVAAMVLFNQSNDNSGASNDDAGASNDDALTANQQQNGSSGSITGTGLDADVNLATEELKEKAVDLLNKFHNSLDYKVKASLCRVPNRTLVDMKNYYSDRAKDYSVTDVEIEPQPVFEGEMKFIKANVKTLLDGKQGSKTAYFIKDESGDLKLDWHSYVTYEVTPWDEFTKLGDVESYDWHVLVDLNGDEHPDFPEDKYTALKVRSWSPDAINITSAYLKKENIMHQQVMDAYNLGKNTYIFKLRHLGDITNSLEVQEVISLSEFYVTDIEAEASSRIDDVSNSDSSFTK